MVRRSNIKANGSNVDYPVVSKDRDLIIPASRDPVTGGVEEALDLRAMRKTPGFQAVEEVLEDEIGDDTGHERIFVFLSTRINHRTDTIGAACVCVLQEYCTRRSKAQVYTHRERFRWARWAGTGGLQWGCWSRSQEPEFPRRGIMRINTTITSVMEVECLVHRGVGRKTMHRNQEEFHTNIHQALRGLCQSGIVGDAEMLLFYAFREPETGDLKAGTRADLAESIHGHSTHNKNNFGGDELEQTYGVPWAKFADGVIPRPVVEVPGSISIIMTSDGVVIFPSIDLDTILLLSLRHLLQEYFEQCWIRRNSGTLPIPWAQVVLDPSKFYDTEKFAFLLALKDPQTFTIFETLAIGKFLNANTSNNSTPFYFKSDVPEESSRLPDSAPLPPPPLPHTHQINIPAPGSQSTTPAQSALLGSPPTAPAR
ncbi:hypothetical protein B0H10DRAFT_1957397 [Mycena sp. CBHHK59/15]|nr:hypothetical protein B0H10DRAFT_1957397 [Mycena sp. CBHHK59/15]